MKYLLMLVVLLLAPMQPVYAEVGYVIPPPIQYEGQEFAIFKTYQMPRNDGGTCQQSGDIVLRLKDQWTVICGTFFSLPIHNFDTEYVLLKDFETKVQQINLLQSKSASENALHESNIRKLSDKADLDEKRIEKLQAALKAAEQRLAEVELKLKISPPKEPLGVKPGGKKPAGKKASGKEKSQTQMTKDK